MPYAVPEAWRVGPYGHDVRVPTHARVKTFIRTTLLGALTNGGAIPSRTIERSVRYAPIELRAWINAGCPIEPGEGERGRKGVGAWSAPASGGTPWSGSRRPDGRAGPTDPFGRRRAAMARACGHHGRSRRSWPRATP